MTGAKIFFRPAAVIRSIMRGRITIVQLVGNLESEQRISKKTIENGPAFAGSFGAALHTLTVAHKILLVFF